MTVLQANCINCCKGVQYCCENDYIRKLVNTFERKKRFVLTCFVVYAHGLNWILVCAWCELEGITNGSSVEVKYPASKRWISCVAFPPFAWRHQEAAPQTRAAAGAFGPNRQMQMPSTQQLWGSGVELTLEDCLGGWGPPCWFSPLPLSAVAFQFLVCLSFCSALILRSLRDVGSNLAFVRPFIRPSICHGSPWSLAGFDGRLFVLALPRHSPLPHSLSPPSLPPFLLCCSPAAPQTATERRDLNAHLHIGTSRHPGSFKVVCRSDLSKQRKLHILHIEGSDDG